MIVKNRDGQFHLARIIHEGFYCNRRYVAATSLTAGGLAARSVIILFQVCLPPSRARLWSLPRPLLQGGQPLCRIPTKGAPPSELPGGVLPASRLRAPVSLTISAILSRTFVS